MLDSIDFSILKVIKDSGRPIWKKRIFELLHERSQELPGTPKISLQTVGRRVDRLQAEDCITLQILPMSETYRRLILAYTVTESGETMMRYKREELLSELLHNDIETEQTEVERRHQLVVVSELIADELGLSDTTRDRLLQLLSIEEMASLFSLYRVKESVHVLENEETQQNLASLAKHDRVLADILGSDVFPPEFRARFRVDPGRSGGK